MRNDTYGADMDERIRIGEAALREHLLPELEWDESEDSRVVEEVLGSFNASADEGA